MGLRDDLLSAASAYGRAIRRSDPTVSRMLFADPGRLKRLRGGADMLSGNVEAALQTLSDRWPDGATWPPDVPRPPPRPSTADPATDPAPPP